MKFYHKQSENKREELPKGIINDWNSQF